MDGGGGDDRFVFRRASDSTNSGRDAIVRFDRDDDLIDLSRVDADGGRRGNQSFDFVGSRGFTGDAGGRVQADTDGDRDDDLVIALAGVGRLTAADFAL